MPGRIPERFIDDLLARIDIVDVIQERVTLKKAGRDWSARCPFHDERSASFTVSPAKQFYHCFGCGAHGSAIRFLMDYDRLEFPDAIEELAARAGVKVEYEGGGRPVQREDASDLYTLLDAAARFYHQQLANNSAARDYVASRGLSAEMVERFTIGFAPEQWDGLKSALGSNAQRLALLDKAGMLASGDRGNKYDRFRNRIMFPILDRRGRTIAFGGRVLGKDDGPKYLNSPETPLFHKGRELFGLWQVRDAHQKIPRLLVVEGYMDVVALHQFGLTQAVATLGTATTSDHAEILFRNAADVFFCFDGDRAGKQAAWRAVESVLPRMRDGRQAWFLFIPDGEDPDTLIRKEGIDGFEQRLKQATPLSEFFFAETGKDVNLASIDGKARLAERARPLIAQIPDGAFRDLMYAELERLSGARTVIPASTSTPAQAGTRPAQRSLVRSAITLLVQNPALASELQPPWTFSELRLAGVPLLVELIGLCRDRPSLSTGSLLEHFAGREESAALNKLAQADLLVDAESGRSEFLGAIEQLDVQTSQQRLDDLIARQLAGTLSDAERDELRQLMANKPAHKRR
ncbi:MAG: DNA primase [Dokdonella sp.]|jgi:DNA primase|uniref:DNA primase n=1 Tax=Dokdonella sp. TaxID=2291710 RepID=UPI001B6773A6|nr:DNA primase [Dokdonella sp.]MBK8123194.1 DNA primase [Dokdonella sp.]MBP6327012.1 DNA primase [Dokdonella sp.]MBP6329437.1 DNA primase [Dokdonella sp.]HNV08976.1 DNA primase [Dokdonella sp.]HPW04020.1 DNA primase [Dokdonella sp.]